jgi:hypothetical protein
MNQLGAVEKQRRNLRIVLFSIILGTLPLYCLGILLWGTAPQRTQRTATVAATAQPLTAQPSATVVLFPSLTPFQFPTQNVVLPPTQQQTYYFPTQVYVPPTQVYYPPTATYFIPPVPTNAPTLTPYPTITPLPPSQTPIPIPSATSIPPSETPIQILPSDTPAMTETPTETVIPFNS